jgi:hypothetical protein
VALLLARQSERVVAPLEFTVVNQVPGRGVPA